MSDTIYKIYKLVKASHTHRYINYINGPEPLAHPLICMYNIIYVIVLTVCLPSHTTLPVRSNSSSKQLNPATSHGFGTQLSGREHCGPYNNQLPNLLKQGHKLKTPVTLTNHNNNHTSY